MNNFKLRNNLVLFSRCIDDKIQINPKTIIDKFGDPTHNHSYTFIQNDNKKINIFTLFTFNPDIWKLEKKETLFISTNNKKNLKDFKLFLTGGN